MGFKDNVGAVRGNSANHAQAVFVAYFEKYPNHQQVFPKYASTKPASALKGMGEFQSHTKKVLDRLLEIADIYADGGDLNVEAKKLAAMGVHKTRVIKEYEDLFVVLVPYLQGQLGGACDKDAWDTFLAKLTTALKGAM